MTLPMQFRDRADAGRYLASKLMEYADRDDVILLALPRGGVPVAYEIAKALGAPLDVLLVRKLGTPGHEELAMGAIAEGGFRVMNDEVVQGLQIPDDAIEEVTRREQEELARRSREYRGDAHPPDVQGKIAILVDDGLATGASMKVAARAVAHRGCARRIIAVPVAPPETCRDLAPEVDRIVCAVTPAFFGGVGRWYVDFEQTTDEEVRNLLDAARRPARRMDLESSA